MENIEKLIQDTLKLFPEEIDISDGELRNDNGFFSQKLSKAWHSAEDKNAIAINDPEIAKATVPNNSIIFIISSNTLFSFRQISTYPYCEAYGLDANLFGVKFILS